MCTSIVKEFPRLLLVNFVIGRLAASRIFLFHVSLVEWMITLVAGWLTGWLTIRLIRVIVLFIGAAEFLVKDHVIALTTNEAKFVDVVLLGLGWPYRYGYVWGLR